MDIKNVGVVGCGLMGRGIAEVSAKAGYNVVVSEINQELLDKGLAAIDRSLSKAVEKGKSTKEDKELALGRIKGTISREDFKDCDIVIEVVPEKMEMKKEMFSALDRICPPNTILASNTSSLSILDMAVATKRPDKVVGLHFFQPVPVMRPVELVVSIVSGEETVKTARAFGESLGKTVVTAKDAPGFIVNGLLIPYLLNSIRMYEAGFATKEDIDHGIEGGLNHPMGPLTLSDFIGLDTIYFISEAMYQEFKDPMYGAPVLLRKMVTAGQLGRKSGKGFYDY